MRFAPPEDVDIMKLDKIKGKENIIAALKKSNEFVLAKILEIETASNLKWRGRFLVLLKMNKMGSPLAIMEHNEEHK